MGIVNNDADKRVYYLSDGINNKSIGNISFNLLTIIEDDDKKDKEQKDYKRQPIKLFINSFGGSVYDSWGLIDVILNSKTPIYTYCCGYAMSAAFDIFLAGHKRYMFKHSTFMYHQIWNSHCGTYQDIIEDQSELTYLQNTNEEYVLQRTKIPKEKLEEVRIKKQDWYIHCDEAKKYEIAELV